MMVLDARRGAQRKERLVEQFGADLRAPVQPAMPPLDYERPTRCVESLKERGRTVVAMCAGMRTRRADARRLLPGGGPPRRAIIVLLGMASHI